MTIKQTIMTFVISAFSLGAIVSIAVTSSPVFAAKCGGVETSIVSCSQTGPCVDGSSPDDDNKCDDGSAAKTDVKDSGAWGVLLLVINIMTAGIGILAVGAIAYGSVMYSSAGGSSEQTKKAITIITNTVIGLVCYLLMSAILNFLIPGGLFNAAA